MINNITNVDARLHQQTGVAKATTSMVSIPMPPVLGFKTPILKEKATLRVKKFKRSDNIVIVGEIDDDYVDIVEEDLMKSPPKHQFNFFQLQPEKKKTAFLKKCKNRHHQIQWQILHKHLQYGL